MPLLTLLSRTFGLSSSLPLIEHRASPSTSSGSALPSSLLPTLLSSCSSLSSPFHPSPHLATGHGSTIYSALANTLAVDAVRYERHVLLLPDGGTLSVDVASERTQEGEKEGNEKRETVVMLHGLTGGSDESYVRHVVKHLVTRDGKRYRCAVVNSRGCANTPVTSAQMYSGSKTSDARCALLFLRSHYPDSPLFGLGFSLGANIMAKLLGEDSVSTPLWGALVCAPPTDMVAGSTCLEEGGGLRAIYSRKMCGNLARLAARHKDTLGLHAPLQTPLRTLLGPLTEEAKTAASARGIKAGSLKWADDVLTRHVGGHSTPYGPFPFAHADEYYKEAGAINHLGGVARPLLVLNADDDPIVAPESVSAVREAMGLNAEEGEEKGNGYIALVTTPGGGHLGWWSGLRPTRWLAQPVGQWFDALSSHLPSSHAAPTAPRATRAVDVDVEFMPVQALPAFSISADWDGEEEAPQAETEKEKEEQEQRHMGLRHAWLRTHLMQEAPLLHPSASPKYKEPKEEERERKGWTMWKGSMTIDAERPEVGFLELPVESRVAGAGCLFQAGIEVPGGGEAADLEGVMRGL